MRGPRPELAPFVRAYVQRTVGPADPSWTHSVPAHLEQILNLEFGALLSIGHREQDVSREMLVGGAHRDFAGTLAVRPGAESFADRAGLQSTSAVKGSLHCKALYIPTTSRGNSLDCTQKRVELAMLADRLEPRITS